MKNSIQTLTIITILFFQLTSSYGQEETLKLLGSWNFDYELSYERLKEKKKRYFNQLEETVQTEIKENYQTRQINFLEDGSYSLVSDDEVLMNGIWDFMEDQGVNYILAFDAEEVEHKFRIIKVSSSKLILKNKSTKWQTDNDFSVWCFTKNN